MLTKTEYLRGRQCLKSLWLLKKYPKYATDPSPMQLSVMAQGKLVGEWARKCFPEGVLIEEHDLEKAANLTKSSGADILFEAAAHWNGFGARADILKRTKNGWEIIEVKSSGEVKEEHIQDVAMQVYVFENAGYPIHRISIMHINKQYIRHGDIEPTKLFVIHDVTDVIDAQQKLVAGFLDEQMKTLNASTEPEILVGSHCHHPHECPFKNHCWKALPEDSIFHMKPALDKEILAELVHRKIQLATQIPEEIELSSRQQIYLQHLRRNEVEMNKKVLSRFLAAIEEPISYLDFETIGTAVPLYEGSSPYQKIPFQYSLHIQEGNQLIHKEYLCKKYYDPREELLLQLLAELPPKGSILAYNAAFEMSVLTKLAEEFPKYANQIRAILPRFVDLLKPFRQGMYVHPKFKGSCSLKIVLPTLVPDMDYETLDVGDGAEAEMAYLDLIVHNNQKRIEQLLLYCGQDTLALVKVLAVLKKECQ